MSNQQNPILIRIPNGNESELFQRMIWIRDSCGEWVTKNAARLSKRNLMLPQILLRFPRIPDELHANSLADSAKSPLVTSLQVLRQLPTPSHSGCKPRFFGPNLKSGERQPLGNANFAAACCKIKCLSSKRDSSAVLQPHPSSTTIGTSTPSAPESI